MQKYRVIVHGRNLLADFDGVRQKAGFFTNVFLEALTKADAEARALALVRNDSHVREISLNGENDPMTLAVDEIKEIENFDGVKLPRSGLSLYRQT